MARAQKTSISETPDISALEGFVGYNLKRAYLVVYEDFRNAIGQDGLAPRAFSALATVIQYPSITQSAVARHLQIERSGLVAIVDDLEQRGLVQRTPVPGDRRAQALLPTADGKRAFAEARAAVKAHEDALFKNFTDQERDTLLCLLNKIRKIED